MRGCVTARLLPLNTSRLRQKGGNGLLELIFQGFMEWAYGLVMECWEYFSSALLDIMSLDLSLIHI